MRRPVASWRQRLLRRLSPPVLLSLIYAGLIVLGTLLLKLPAAHDLPLTWSDTTTVQAEASSNPSSSRASAAASGRATAASTTASASCAWATAGNPGCCSPEGHRPPEGRPQAFTASVSRSARSASGIGAPPERSSAMLTITLSASAMARPCWNRPMASR